MVRIAQVDENRAGKSSMRVYDLTEMDGFTSDEESNLIIKNLQNEGQKQPYPKSVFFIVSNEFCERFSYYGMRTILTLYLTRILLYGDDDATMIFHVFAMACYFTPLLGAIIADSWLGKFRTILYISILYAAGNITIALGAIPQPLAAMNTISLIGLAVIALGTGGIKPCVSAFGGDQFNPGQEKQLQRFFSLFYMSINAGSLISTFLTPYLREDVHCFGQKSCFSLAFGVPAILMVTATLLFVFGKPFYKILPAEGNIVVRVVKCISHAIAMKFFKKNTEKKSHWLEYADDKYDRKLISDIKILLHVLVLYIPLPVFWALFDQQGSRWTLQAARMNGDVLGFYIKPDQMQVINPFLIIAFIPLFDYVFYPILKKVGFSKPLQKITAGGLLAAVAFVIAGFVEIKLEGTYPVLPAPGRSDIMIINNSPCNVKVDEANINEILAFEKKILQDIPLYAPNKWTLTPEKCSVSTPLVFTFNSSSPIESLMITIHDGALKVLQVKDHLEKPEKGDPEVRFFINSGFMPAGKIHIKLVNANERYNLSSGNLQEAAYGISKYYPVSHGTYHLYLALNATHFEDKPSATVQVHNGATYIIGIYKPSPESVAKVEVFGVVDANTVHILLQIPQYVLITGGEIMFSITGLEFSYSQSPASMKSVLQAAWLLTVAFGNLIVVIVAEAKVFEKRSHELFMFAALMALDMIIFAIMAYFYKYVTIEQTAKSTAASNNAKNNGAYEEETDFTK